jgi:hypothetical protein
MRGWVWNYAAHGCFGRTGFDGGVNYYANCVKFAHPNAPGETAIRFFSENHALFLFSVWHVVCSYTCRDI